MSVLLRTSPDPEESRTRANLKAEAEAPQTEGVVSRLPADRSAIPQASRPLDVVVCGLGYVGATMAACLLGQGHRIVGIDMNPEKTAALARGESPIVEPGVDHLLAVGHAEGRLSGSDDIGECVTKADIVLVCVGTPSRPDGSLDLSQVVKVCHDLADAIRCRPDGAQPILCVFRSTMLPGSMEETVIPTLARAVGEAPGSRYEVAYNPEFLRESTAVADYFSPPKIVVGERQPGASQRLLGLYDGIEAAWSEVPLAVAEMVKYVDNSFHALKVAFANEVGRIATCLAIDPQAVMDIFVSDTKLNISPYYLKPGGPFGGSCLPKDVRALNAFLRERALTAPVLENILASNAVHKEFLAERVRSAAPEARRVLLLGLSFKSKTDDLRESPLVDLAGRLVAAGYELEIYDPDLRREKLLGANREFALQHLPDLSQLLISDVSEAALRVDVAVVGKPMPQALAVLPPELPVVNVHLL